MERGREFIVSDSVEAKPQTVGYRVYEAQELKADASIFSEAAQRAIKKADAGGMLSREEQKMLQEEREEWWLEKYGFPYSQKTARVEVLMRKYAPSSERGEAIDLQRRLFAAFRKNDAAGIEAVRAEYEANYPDQLEGVTTLFELIPFLELQEQVDTRGYRFSRDDFERLTQFQFLLTDFIKNNGGDKEFLRGFWTAAERLARESGTLRNLNRLRRGVLSQVATFKVFEALGYDPKLSHPKEDAFQAIDLWTDEAQVVQIKGAHAAQPLVVETEEIAFPGVEVEDKKKKETQHFDSFLFKHLQRFRAKVKRYSDVVKKNLKGYMIVVPYSKFDFVTGEPAPDLVAYVKGHLAQGERKQAA